MNHGGDVWQGGAPESYLDFSANIRPGGAPQWVRHALMQGMNAICYYPDPQMRRARVALAKYLGLDAAWVLPTAGGISAIDMAVHLQSTSMLALGPCFGEYARQAANLGIEVRQINLLSQKRPLRPCDAVEGCLTEGCALWLCNPLNPVGCGFSVSEIAALLEKVEAVKGHLLVDEAFIDFCTENTATGLLKDHPRLLITGSMTKALGIPGVRLGYLCANPEYMKALQVYQKTWELNCFAEAVLLELPDHRDEIRQDALENARRRDQLREGLEKMGVYVYPSQSNFLLADFGFSVATIQEELRKKRILVRDCRNFKGIDDGRHLRLAVKDEAANARLLAELKEAMTCGENR